MPAPSASAPSLVMPHVMHKSFISGRGETERLARTNESLQKKVDILEVRLKEQEGLIAAQGTRRAAASGGRAEGSHLSLACYHLGSSVSGCVSAFFATLCSALCCLCDEYTRHRAGRRDHARLDEGTHDADEQDDEGDRGGDGEASIAEAVRKARKNHLIPSWDTAAEKEVKLLTAKGTVPKGAFSPGLFSSRSAEQVAPQTAGSSSPQKASRDLLENHEYVLEEEWGNVPTNGVINPKSRWKETWDLGVLTFILYSSIVVPFRICFSAEAEGNMWFFEVGISFFFLADVLFNFNTAYSVDDKWVINHSRIIGRYLSGWFWIDMPASLPIEIMTMNQNGDDGGLHLGLLRFLRMFRLLRLLRLLKVDVYIAQIEDQLEINLVSLRILGMVSRLMFMVHLLGCFWFYVAATAMEGGETVTWVSVYNDGSAVDGPTEEQYLFSVYWALTTLTTVGYGDITPQNNAERYYSLFAMLVGAMMFGYMMSTIGSMVTQMDREAQLKEDRMDAVKEWMASRNIPHKLFVRVRKYYEHYYSRKSAFDEGDILAALTPALKTDVTKVLLKDSLGNFPLFSLLGIEFQTHIYPQLKPVAYANMDVVYHRGEDSDDLFFLRKGTIDVLASGLGSEVLYRISSGQYFGEEVLTGQRRGCTIVSNGFTEMWSLSKDVLDDTMSQFPELILKLDEFVVVELERKRRLYALSYRILIGCAIDPQRRAALIVQKAWTQFAAQAAKARSNFAPEVLKDFISSASSPGPRKMSTLGGQRKSAASFKPPPLSVGVASFGSADEAEGASNTTRGMQALSAQLKDMNLSLHQIKRHLDAKAPLKARAGPGGKGDLYHA